MLALVEPLWPERATAVLLAYTSAHVLRFQCGFDLTCCILGTALMETEYRYNNGPWVPLPERLRFDDQGHYQLELRAIDRVGQETRATWSVRTGNFQAIRPENQEGQP